MTGCSCSQSTAANTVPKTGCRSRKIRIDLRQKSGANPEGAQARDTPAPTTRQPHPSAGQDGTPDTSNPPDTGTRHTGDIPTPTERPSPIGCDGNGSKEAFFGPYEPETAILGVDKNGVKGGCRRPSDRDRIEAYLRFGEMAVKPHQRRILDSLTPNAAALLEHLIRCTSRRTDQRVPVPSTAMREQLPQYEQCTADVWRPLQERGFILVSGYTPPEGAQVGRCREFRLTERFWKAWTGSNPYGRPTRRVDGRRHRSGRMAFVTVLQDEHGDPVAEGAAMDLLRLARDHPGITVDWQALVDLQERRRHQLEQLDPAAEGYERLSERYHGDLLRMQTMRAQELSFDGRWLTYRPAYALQEKSGRVTELGGGFQGLTREAKDAAMREQETVYNYDLAGAHQAIAVAFGEALGVGIDPVRALDRTALTASCGLRKREGKAALYGTFNGASLPKSMAAAVGQERSTGRSLAVPDVARQAAARQGVDPAEIYGALRRSLEPVRDAMRELLAAYCGRYADEHATYGRGGRYLQNASGVRLNLQAVDLQSHGGRSLAACHLLQGTEAAVGHELARLQDRYGYRILSHEHDGVVTAGRVPPAAVQEALQAISDRIGVDLTGLELVLKPYDEREPEHWSDEQRDQQQRARTGANAAGSAGRRGGDGRGHVRESLESVSKRPGERGMATPGDGRGRPHATADPPTDTGRTRRGRKPAHH